MFPTSDQNFSINVISIFNLKELKDNTNETYFSSTANNFLSFEIKKINVKEKIFMINKVPKKE